MARRVQLTDIMVRVGASARDVRGVFGDVGDLTVDRIVQTGASMVEIGEALASIEAEQDDEQGQPLSSGRVVDVRAILAALLWPEEHDDSLSDGATASVRA